MNVRLRENVPAVAAVLSLVSLGLVLGTAGGLVPGDRLPQFDPLLDVIPHLNALLSATAIVVILAGLREIRRGNVRRHRRAMLSGFALFATFLVLYLYRVAVRGPTHFDGPGWLATYLYVPILAIHILLAVVCVPLLYYVALLAISRPVAEIPLTRHRAVGRVTAVLWLLSFGLGIVVYGLLYWVY